MRLKSFLKYNFMKIKNELLSFYVIIGIFYFINFIFIKYYNAEIRFSGIDVFTNFMLMLVTVCLVRDGCRLTTTYNLSRKLFNKGMVIFLITISFVTAIIDVVLGVIADNFMENFFFINSVYSIDNDIKGIILLVLIFFVMHLTAVSAGYILVNFYTFSIGTNYGMTLFLGTLIGLWLILSIVPINFFYIAGGNPSSLELNIFLDLIWIIVLFWGGSTFIKKAVIN